MRVYEKVFQIVFWVRGLRFAAWSLGIRFRGLELRGGGEEFGADQSPNISFTCSSWCRVLNWGFRIKELGLRLQGLRFGGSGFGFGVLSLRFLVFFGGVLR